MRDDECFDTDPPMTPEQEAEIAADYQEWLYRRGEKDRQIASLTAALDAEKQRADRLEAENANLVNARDSYREGSQKHMADRDRLRQALKAVEWAGEVRQEMRNGEEFHAYTCPNPDCERTHEEGHAPDCIVGLALEGRK